MKENKFVGPKNKFVGPKKTPHGDVRTKILIFYLFSVLLIFFIRVLPFFHFRLPFFHFRLPFFSTFHTIRVTTKLGSLVQLSFLYGFFFFLLLRTEIFLEIFSKNVWLYKI